jgi:hypothetical protein
MFILFGTNGPAELGKLPRSCGAGHELGGVRGLDELRRLGYIYIYIYILVPNQRKMHLFFGLGP